MPDDIDVSNFVTKKLIIKDDSQDRFFEGILSAEIKDRQGEITDIEELYKALPVWMERNAPMSDTHSNRIVGRGINFEKVTIKTKNGEDIPAIKILGKIHSNTALDDFIWEQIKSGEYKGLSFGGATKANREPIVQSDGTMAYRLKDLEIYEVAVCEDPAVAFALITDVNPLAKSYVEKDSLVKIEDDEDENTQVTVLDEWKNEKHPDKNGKTEGIRTTKAYHVEKDGEELKARCDGTTCYINAEVRKANFGESKRIEAEPKEVPTMVGEAKGARTNRILDELQQSDKKSFFGQDEEDYPVEDKTKPLPTKWGKMEFDACEAHAKKDPTVKNPGGYCGSIQQHVDKDTKVHAGKQEYSSTESCISGEGKKPGIKDPEAYCGSRHNVEHGMNPMDTKHKDTGAQAAGTGTGVGNQCDSKSQSCSEKPDLSEAGLDEVDKPTGDREYFKKSCGCQISLQKDIVGGTENPRGLGAYNTSVQGSGGSNQVSQQVTDPARLGDPEKLESNPKTPKDPTVKSSFEESIMKYWEENKTSDTNSELHLAIKDYIENYQEQSVTLPDTFLKNLTTKAYMDRTEEEWIIDVTKFSKSPEGIAQYGSNIEVSPEGNLVNESGDIIFINPFI